MIQSNFANKNLIQHQDPHQETSNLKLQTNLLQNSLGYEDLGTEYHGLKIWGYFA